VPGTIGPVTAPGASTHHPAVIRNVVIHVANEQPLLADLFEMPTSADVSLVCTNIRMLDGKKPVFVDYPGSVFIFPYQSLRFVEIMAASVPGLTPEGEDLVSVPADGGSANGHDEAPDEAEADLELDEDFLRRIREV
jgi:hypothetical protein